MESVEKEELSLVEIIDIVKEYTQFLWDKKLWIFLVVFLTTSVFFGFQYTKKPVYLASLDFMINENEGGGGGLNGILGQFGMVGGASEGGINQQRVILIGKSYPVLSSFLMDSLYANGTYDRIANHIITTQKLDTSWKVTIDTWAASTTRSDSMNIAYNQVMKNVVRYLSSPDKGPVFNIDIDLKTNVMKVIFQTRSAELSVGLSSLFYDKLLERYIEKTTSAKQRDYDILTEKKDSIYGLLLGTERQFARYSDQNRALVLYQDKVPFMDKQRKIEMYNKMYVELITRQQTAEYLLLSSMPLFEVLEYPLLPLSNSNGLNLGYIILFVVVAFIVVCVSFILWKVVHSLEI